MRSIHLDMIGADGTTLQGVTDFLQKLEETHIHFRLSSVREGAIMVEVAVPSERWEIEFFPGRSPEIEIFRSDGNIGGPELIDDLLERFSD